MCPYFYYISCIPDNNLKQLLITLGATIFISYIYMIVRITYHKAYYTFDIINIFDIIFITRHDCKKVRDYCLTKKKWF